MEQKKQEWYIKLLAKLKRIESGELSLTDYISEVEEKLRQPFVISSVCTCTKLRETPMINGKHICSICNKLIVQTDL